jgi:hypothetical protein
MKRKRREREKRKKKNCNEFCRGYIINKNKGGLFLLVG